MRIACVLADMFEDDEFGKPYQAFREAGHQVIVTGSEAPKTVKGYRGQLTQQIDRSITDVRPDEFDAVFIPGGYSPDHLRADPRMVEFVRAMVESGRPCFAICHGPQLLMTAHVVAGRTMTAWKTVQDDLRQVGADVVDQEVVEDGNLITSRMPADIPAFIEKSLGKLEQLAPR